MIAPLQLAGLIVAMIGVGQAWKNPRAGAALMVLGGMLFGAGTITLGGRLYTILGGAWMIVVPLFAFQRGRIRRCDAERAAAARASLERIRRAGSDPP